MDIGRDIDGEIVGKGNLVITGQGVCRHSGYLGADPFEFQETVNKGATPRKLDQVLR
jgi:hypothetical protein